MQDRRALLSEEHCFDSRPCSKFSKALIPRHVSAASLWFIGSTTKKTKQTKSEELCISIEGCCPVMRQQARLSHLLQKKQLLMHPTAQMSSLKSALLLLLLLLPPASRLLCHQVGSSTFICVVSLLMCLVLCALSLSAAFFLLSNFCGSTSSR